MPHDREQFLHGKIGKTTVEKENLAVSFLQFH